MTYKSNFQLISKCLYWSLRGWWGSLTLLIYGSINQLKNLSLFFSRPNLKYEIKNMSSPSERHCEHTPNMTSRSKTVGCGPVVICQILVSTNVIMYLENMFSLINLEQLIKASWVETSFWAHDKVWGGFVWIQLSLCVSQQRLQANIPI